MNELIKTPDAQAPQQYGLITIDDLIRGLEHKKEVAIILMKSGLIPSSLNSVEKVLAVMFKAQELRIPPIEGLNQLSVINGKVTMQGALMLALISKSGKCRELDIKETGDSCTVFMSRNDYKHEYTFTFSMNDAHNAGLSGKDVWKKYKTLMLKWRAVSGCARTVFSDVIGGLYVPEEIISIDPNIRADVNDNGEVIVIETIKPDEKKAPEVQPAAEILMKSTKAQEIKAPEAPKVSEVQSAAEILMKTPRRNFSLEAQIRTEKKELSAWWNSLTKEEKNLALKVKENRKEEISKNEGVAREDSILLSAIKLRIESMTQEDYFRDKEILKSRIEDMTDKKLDMISFFNGSLSRLGLTEEPGILPF